MKCPSNVSGVMDENILFAGIDVSGIACPGPRWKPKILPCPKEYLKDFPFFLFL